MKYIRAVVVLLGLLWAGAAAAQGVVLQSGPVVPNHPAAFQSPGVIFDPGPASGGLAGSGINEGLFTVPPTSSGSAAPWSNTGTGPFGTNICDTDGPITGPRHYFCISPNSSDGTATIATGALGGASAIGFSFRVDGVKYNFPFTIGGIVGPAISVPNDFACWNNTIGTLLKDCPASTVSLTVGSTAITSGTSGRVLYDNAGVLGELVVTGSGNAVLATSPTLVTPTLTSPTMTAPTLGVAIATSLNGLTLTTSTGVFTLTNGKTLAVTNSLTLAGTDGTTWTGPTTSATLLSTAGATLQATPSNPIGNATATFKMAGLGGTCHITPVNSTRLLIIFYGDIGNDTTNDVAFTRLSYGTGSAPTNGASSTGTLLGNPVAFFSPSANFTAPFSVAGVASGLTSNTAYWIDLQVADAIGGTASVTTLTCTATEI